MNTLGNIIWIVFGGLFLALGYVFSGLLLCCTIIGIPFGIQIFKIGSLALFPFGRKSVVSEKGSGCLCTFMNIFWLLFGGICLALEHLVLGVLFCITIIGIPFGRQHFKLMAVALTPFGREIVNC
ncbi:MAG: YccF domain-containing protein [Coprobacter sp.]|nr:YccF domain-containing protein [Coprobacter sp.]